MPVPENEVLPKQESTETTIQSDQSLSNKTGAWIKHHYLALINIALAIYAFLPMMAPVLMKTGQTSGADVVYKLYKPLCHQLAYRSFFLFGEQIVYPRELAGIVGLKSYEEVIRFDSQDQLAAIAFRGNEQLGYKIALCQRDLAIYLSLLLFGLMFSITGRKLKPLPWLAWIIFALVPIGLDGFSQLISQMEIPFLGWLSVRESTPLLRVLSGSMFGWFTAWFGLPSIEEMMNEKKSIDAIASVPTKGK